MKNRRLKYQLLLLAVLGAAAVATYWPTPRRQALARVAALDGTYARQADPADPSHELAIVLLTHRPVTEPDLAALRDLRPLDRVFLSGSPVSDAGLAYVGELEELEMLHLIGTPVTDAGLVHLRGLKRLKSLSLKSTGVTDAGLVHLRELTGLRILNVAFTRVTDQGVAELQRSLPNTAILLHEGQDH